MALVAAGRNRFCSMVGCTARIKFDDGLSASFMDAQLVPVLFVSHSTGTGIVTALAHHQ